MAKIRVLVVDDSSLIRKVVSEELAADPQIEIAATAANGRIALARMTQVNPDLVILDVEMPEMDGLAALAELRKTHPRVPVIMFSALTERGAAATLDALALGASDYFTKPSGPGGLDSSRQVIRDELIPAIKALCRDRVAVSLPASAPPLVTSPTQGPHARVDVVAIGVSTGGPNALAEIFRGLPADLSVPILIVQHMPPLFTKLLAERLSAIGSIPVEEATSGVELRPGRAWIAPGDFHMTVARSASSVRVRLNQDQPENSCRPAVDPLFRSIANSFGANCLAVILTGMGQDGLRGSEAIRSAGGQVIAQDEASSVVWGMPGFVVRAGLADKVLPLAQVGGEIVRRVSALRSGAP